MSEHNPQSRTNDESIPNSEGQTPTGYVERSDVGVSLTVKISAQTSITATAIHGLIVPKPMSSVSTIGPR